MLLDSRGINYRSVCSDILNQFRVLIIYQRMNNRLFPEEISENEKISSKLIVNVDRKYLKNNTLVEYMFNIFALTLHAVKKRSLFLSKTRHALNDNNLLVRNKGINVVTFIYSRNA